MIWPLQPGPGAGRTSTAFGRSMAQTPRLGHIVALLQVEMMPHTFGPKMFLSLNLSLPVR